MPDISKILALGDTDKIVSILCVDTKEDRNPQEYRDEYNGKRTRREESVGSREDKHIDVYSDTETETDKDGNEVPKKIGHDTVKVAKIHTNYPKRIVRIAANFLFGGEMSVTFDGNNEATEYFRKVWEKKLRMKSVLKKFTRTVMVETKAAMLFYPRVKSSEEIDVRVKILSVKDGESYPHFDDYGDMDAFTHRYKRTDPLEGKETECVDIYTAETTYKYENLAGSWSVKQQKNLIGIIPIVYVEIDTPEYEDIVTALDKLETRLSRLIDTNDYFSEPILKSYGATNLPSKKTVGKQLEFEMEVDPDTGKVFHGDAEYLTWQQTVESIKLELDELKNEILAGTSTPDLSFDNLKGLGALSGIAIKLMFLDAFLKREDNMEVFSPAVSRSVSVVRTTICNVAAVKYKSQLEDSEIDVEFGSVLPDDLREEMEILAMANGNRPINLQKTVTARSRFTKNPDEEFEQIQKEKQEEASSMVGSLM